jgi:hypothetical protein
MTDSEDPGTAAVISLAPCHSGSADLFRWVNAVTSGMASGDLGELRMNPTQTLHAVDNLAMSSFAINYGNRADCLGLGGAPGQAWCGLEAVLERFEIGLTDEVLLMAGDQDSGTSDTGLGIAFLFSSRPKPYASLNQVVRLVRIERQVRTAPADIQPHAAKGLSQLVSAINQQKQGLLSYDVPRDQTDGLSSITVVAEIS